MTSRRIRELMHARPVVGTFLKLPRAEVVDILALAGFDFVVCDLEHARIAEHELREVLLASRAHELPVIVRPATLDRGLINHVLELGAAGIQLPRTNSGAVVEELISVTRFPPAGSRSVGTAHLGARYGGVPVADYVDDVDAPPLLVGQLETQELGQPVDDTIRGLDIAFIGTVDITVSCGAPGDLDSPQVTRSVREIEDAARRTDVPLGVFASGAHNVSRWVASGYRYIAVSGDISMIAAGAQTLLASLDATTRSP